MLANDEPRREFVSPRGNPSLGAFGLGAIICWVGDVLYKRRTGKPASERIRENKELAKALLTEK